MSLPTDESSSKSTASDLIRPDWRVSLGLFVIAMSVVLLELVLSRFFSVSTGFHFAFMIVSITMFGMTIGAIATFLKIPRDEGKVLTALSTSSSLFAISIPVAFVLQILYNHIMDALTPFGWIGVTFITFSVPFFFAGVCLSLCLSRFQSVGRLYAYDLLGAAVSCPLLVGGLTYASGPAVLMTCGILAAVSSMLFTLRSLSGFSLKGMILPLTAVVLCVVALVAPLPDFRKVADAPVEYVRWTPLGRVIVTSELASVFTWGKKKDDSASKMTQKGLFIDSGALTVMTKASDPETLAPLKEDLTAVGNAVRPADSLFVIGAGGGRDILTGLLFEQKSIDACEVNPAIVEMLKGKYADFVGRIHEKPGVNIVNEEARVWLEKSKKKYGLIQCSLVDTWAASSSGAFMLTENVLYTKEAFQVYLDHLKPTGVFSVIRWGDEKRPAELFKLLALARSSLNSRGIQDTNDKIMMIGGPSNIEDAWMGLMLMSPTAFSQADIDLIKNLCTERGYKILWLPNGEGKEPFISYMKAPVTTDLPSDDRPFFFTSAGLDLGTNEGLAILVFTFLLSFVLVSFTILLPLWLKVGAKLTRGALFLPSAIYFTTLGMGFMLVEVGLIQRLTIFLGSPTYGLTVVLFALLLSSGAGSYFTQWRIDAGASPAKLARIGLLMSGLLSLVACFVTLTFASMFPTIGLMERVALSILVVATPGFFMGWCFPLGMTMFAGENVEAGAWFWGVNGATSVLGSIIAAIISIQLGITYTLATGGVVYLLAILSTFGKPPEGASSTVHQA